MQFNTLKRAAMAALMAGASFGLHSEVLFQDGFESGDLSHVQDGTAWGRYKKSYVVSDKALNGDYSLAFDYTGDPDPKKDSWSELRFKLGKPVSDFWMRYDLFVPENYVHRYDGRPANNKGLVMLWNGEYTNTPLRTSVAHWNSEMIRGQAVFGDIGDSMIAAEGTRGGRSFGHQWVVPGSDQRIHTILDVGEESPHDPDNFTDNGKWVTFVVNVRVSDIDPNGDGKTGNGAFGVWKCLAPCEFEDFTPDNATFYYPNFYAWAPTPEQNHFTDGYILGWANSGFAVDTKFYLDNVIIANAKEDVLSGTAQPASPLPPILRLLGIE